MPGFSSAMGTWVMGGGWRSASPGRAAAVLESQDAQRDGCRKQEGANRGQKHLNAMMYADSREQALKERKKFEHAFSHNPRAVKTVVENWEKLTITTIFPARTGNTYGPRTWWNPRSHGCGLEPQHRDDSNRRSTQPV